MDDKFTIADFRKRFPDDDACLEEIRQIRFADFVCPKCGRENELSRVKGRTSYACNCGYQVYPLAGTVFEKSTTSLWSWFYTMYLMVQTRAGISAKQLERELGVTYKTAWRMAKQIRTLMSAEDGELLSGEVEVDETFIGGKDQNRHRSKKHENKGGYRDKAVVFGMVERGGKVKLRHVPHTGTEALTPHISVSVHPNATIYHDEHGVYAKLYKVGFTHKGIRHQKRQYVDGPVHTQNIENVWSHLKRGITGVYRHVSPKYLQLYANEYGWRYSHRTLRGQMFDALVSQVSLPVAKHG